MQVFPRAMVFSDRRNKKIHAKQLRKAIARKCRKFKQRLQYRSKSERNKEKNEILYKAWLEKRRRWILKEAHSGFTYQKDPITVSIRDEFGLTNTASALEKFIKDSSQLVDFDVQTLTIDIHKCTKVWPSAVMLLCSLVQWLEFGEKYFNTKPHLRSTYSDNDRVNGYLVQSGFFDYVKVNTDVQVKSKHRMHVIKIEREQTKDSVEVSKKEDGIVDLLEKYTNYSKDDVRLFVSTAIMEVFLNIQEHGIQVKDQGWWFLAQYHQHHQTISINIADNGIGFKSSLMSGPQKEQIEEKVASNDDGEIMKYAMKESVSGASDATREETRGFFHRGYYPPGSIRGNGLDRMRETCKTLRVPFAILSHYGYIYYDADGKLAKYGTEKNRVFAGTLYHFDIPAKGEE